MRHAAGLTLAELGSQLERDHTYLNKLERGKQRCPAPLAWAWAEACGFRATFSPVGRAVLEEAVAGLTVSERELVTRLSQVLPTLAPEHRATLVHLVDLWERAAAPRFGMLAADSGG